MNSFRRLSSIDQAEAAIEQALAEGRWQETLPSYQNLAKMLDLSTPTAAKAVTRLVERGLLISPGPRQRFRIARKRMGTARSRGTADAIRKPRRHLLILSPNKPEEWDMGQRQVVLETLQQAIADGWECSQETVDFMRAGTIPKRWDNLLIHHHATHLFAIQGTRQLAQWARSKGLKVAFVGGHTLKPAEGTSLGIHLSDQLGHCVRHLQALGHRRILLPYWGDVTGFAAFAAKVLGENLRLDPARLIEEGCVFGVPHTTPDEHRDRRSRHLRKLGPTAVITVDWHDYLVATQCAAAAGLRIPKDLSLAVLIPSPDTEWALPRPAHYRIQQSFFIDGIRDWRLGKPVTHEAMTRAVVAAWNPGETIAPARADV